MATWFVSASEQIRADHARSPVHLGSAGTWRAELRSHAIILACVMVVVAVLGGRAVKATRMLAAQALQDGLTGLANRRSFDETIEREIRRSARSDQTGFNHHDRY